MSNRKPNLGTHPIPNLLLKQSLPATIGIFTIFLYNIVDTIFVGQWVGKLGIGAMTVVLPISMLIASIGMALGVGGSSVISRALGDKNEGKANNTFGNLISLTIVLSVITVFGGYVFEPQILRVFGAQGEIYSYASQYYRILLIGVPFVAFAMMSNNVMRAEGDAKTAMYSMIIPGVVNLILDPVFMLGFGMGIQGAALATSISYFSSFAYTFWYFFLSGRSDLQINWSSLRLKAELVWESASLGVTTLARQGSASLLAVVVNNTLFPFGGADSIAIWGIIQRIAMFAFFPLFGLNQGFLPITGFNYGAKQFGRVLETLKVALIAATVLCSIGFLIVYLFSPQLMRLFTPDSDVVTQGKNIARIFFLATPIVGIQVLGAGYFQAVGKAVPALVLTLTRQVIILIPLVLIFSRIWGEMGVWMSFPIAEALACVITSAFLVGQVRKLRVQKNRPIEAHLVDKED